MPHDPTQNHRRSIRLKNYDYRRPGAYFLTIVTQGRLCIYGEIVNNAPVLNPAGQMVEKWWLELSHKYAGVELDEYVVMPNHFHGILLIQNGDDKTTALGAHTGAPLPTIVQWFKTMTTNAYIVGVKTLGWTPFDRKLWQRNYFEHVIRDERDLAAVRQYVHNNPAQWALDSENPNAAQA